MSLSLTPGTTLGEYFGQAGKCQHLVIWLLIEGGQASLIEGEVLGNDSESPSMRRVPYPAARRVLSLSRIT